MLTDGTQRTKITNYKDHATHPACSSDGAKLVFQLGEINKRSKKKSEIYSIKTDGSGLTNLSNNPAKDKRSSWLPDSSWICFQSHRSDHWETYTMNPAQTLNRSRQVTQILNIPTGLDI